MRVELTPLEAEAIHRTIADDMSVKASILSKLQLAHKSEVAAQRATPDEVKRAEPVSNEKPRA